jgi:hypothetical protein
VYRPLTLFIAKGMAGNRMPAIRMSFTRRFPSSSMWLGGERNLLAFSVTGMRFPVRPVLCHCNLLHDTALFLYHRCNFCSISWWR